MKRSTAVACFVAVVTLTACEMRSYTTGGAFCTEEFRIATVTLIDSAGAPVSGASLVVTVPRTGDTLTSQSLALFVAGTYPIVDDGAKPKLTPSGENVHVSATSPKGSIAANYVFNVPDGCHINKVSGPDTLKVQ